MLYEATATITLYEDLYLVLLYAKEPPFPSKGMLMANVSLRSFHAFVILEPDGNGNHFFLISKAATKEVLLPLDQLLPLTLQFSETWIEPEMPTDLKAYLTTNDLNTFWEQLTVKARWDWIRWIRSTSNPATRQKRLNVSISKMQHGEKRPCCFDRTRCTIPALSKSGKLNVT